MSSASFGKAAGLAPRGDPQRPSARGRMMDGSDLRPATHTALAWAGHDEDLISLSWPREQLAQALEALASRAAPAERGGSARSAHPIFRSRERWLTQATGSNGRRAASDVEAEPVEFPVPDLDQGLLQACPLVLALPVTGGARFLLLLKAKRDSIALIGPDLRLHWRRVRTISAAAALSSAHRWSATSISCWRTPMSRPARREQVRSVMLRERLAAQAFTECWMLRLPATAPFMAQLSQAGLLRRLGWVVALLIGMYLVEISGWALIGAAVLNGRLDLAWLVAWQLAVAIGHPAAALRWLARGDLRARSRAYPEAAPAGRRAAHRH